MDDFVGAVLEGFPLLLGFWLDVSGFSWLYLCVEIVSSFFDTALEISAHCGEDRIEEFARCGDGLLDTVWIVYLFLPQSGTVLLDRFLDLWLADCLLIGEQSRSIGKYFLEVGDCWRVCE